MMMEMMEVMDVMDVMEMEMMDVMEMEMMESVQTHPQSSQIHKCTTVSTAPNEIDFTMIT